MPERLRFEDEDDNSAVEAAKIELFRRRFTEPCGGILR